MDEHRFSPGDRVMVAHAGCESGELCPFRRHQGKLGWVLEQRGRFSDSLRSGLLVSVGLDCETVRAIIPEMDLVRVTRVYAPFVS